MDKSNSLSISNLEKDKIADLSQNGQNSLKKFLWKLIYKFRSNIYTNNTYEEIQNDLIKEIKKPKLNEIYFKKRKKFAFDDEGKDLIVNI